jgi:hypothetical protein
MFDLLTTSDFVVSHSFLGKQKGQKDAKRTKKEAFCYFCRFLPFLLPRKDRKSRKSESPQKRGDQDFCTVLRLCRPM